MWVNKPVRLGAEGGQGYVDPIMRRLSILPLRLVLSVLAMALVATGFHAAPAAAQDDDDVPYWVQLTAAKANMRVGPGESYRINWVYQRKGLPLKVVRKLSGWRLVEEADGTRGWIVSRFLSRERSAVVVGEGNADMRISADDGAKLLWKLEPGVIGLLGDCNDGWCRFSVGAGPGDMREGFVKERRLWGAGEP